MDKITAIRVKNDDGTYSDKIPIGVLAKDVKLDDGSSLTKVLEDIQTDMVNSKSDWTETDSESLSFISNKPNVVSGTGIDSVIEGCITSDYANEASGAYSHAEGRRNTASGLYSHAEGDGTKAQSECAHAEGRVTTASGLFSHAEGNQTISSGNFTHAEGNTTVAVGNDAHAEGAGTQANANHSHAEGNQTIADGSAGHAEGKETRASAYYTHSEGYGTVATSKAQHVQGQYNVLDTEGGLSTQGRYAHIIGNGTADDARSNAHTLDWDGNAWYAGKVSAEGTPTEDNDLVSKSYVDSKIVDDLADYATMDWIEDKGFIVNETQSDWNGTDKYDASFIQNKPAIKSGTGQNSIIEGNIQANIASGYCSHAEGLSTKAYGDYSHAEGGDTEAVVDYSHAEGQGSRASTYRAHAEGYYTEAMGDSSHSEGYCTLASGQDSHAEGSNTIAAGTYQHVQGIYNIQDTENKYLHIVGNGTDANHRSNAHTLDKSGNAWFSGNVTIEGTPAADKDLVTKKWVEDQGYLTTGGSQSNWIETDTESLAYISNKPNIKAGTGANSIIEGGGAIASGAGSHAEGGGTQATRDCAHAEGSSTNAEGAGSHAEGGGTRASGTDSHAEGGSTTASGDNSHAEGGGTTAIGDCSHAEGAGTKASGSNSHAEGGGTTASGSNSHTEGSGTQASGGQSHAEGALTKAIGGCSHAEGEKTTANSDNSHTEGVGTFAAGYASHVQGKWNEKDTNNTYVHIVGNGTNENNRSNAHTLDWNGNAWYAGAVSAGTVSNPILPINTNHLTTKAYVDEKFNGLANKKVIFFGDSIGEGTGNNNHSFVDIIDERKICASLIKECHASSCVGPYEVYEDGTGYDLISVITARESEIPNADIIFCEYGGNDTQSFQQGKITIGSPSDVSTANTICGYVRRAIQNIRALNSTAEIYWLLPFLGDFSASSTESFLNMDCYASITKCIVKICTDCGVSCYGIYSNLNLTKGAGHIVNDFAGHPTEAGHVVIANNVIHAYPYMSIPYRPLRIITLNANGTYDSDFSKLLLLAQYNIDTIVKYNGLIFHIEKANNTSVVFKAVDVSDTTETEYILVFTSSSVVLYSTTQSLTVIPWDGGGDDPTPDPDPSEGSYETIVDGTYSLRNDSGNPINYAYAEVPAGISVGADETWRITWNGVSHEWVSIYADDQIGYVVGNPGVVGQEDDGSGVPCALYGKGDGALTFMTTDPLGNNVTIKAERFVPAS